MDDWRDIETGPRDRSRVLLATTTAQEYGQVREGQWWQEYEAWSTDWEPTHWMPLPAPPSQEQ